MRIYFLKRLFSSPEIGKRTNPLHYWIYHGETFYTGWGDDAGGHWPGTRDWLLQGHEPSLDNTAREPAHIRRSGQFFPPIFGNFRYDLIVSQEVRNALEPLGVLEFNPVVFETLVEFAMPPLGDFSWLEQDVEDIIREDEMKGISPMSLPRRHLRHCADVPGYHDNIGSYYSVIGRKWRADASTEWRTFPPPSDLQVIHADYGSLPRVAERERNAMVSKQTMEQNPILFGNPWVLREDAYAALAPFLDFDYYAVATHDLDPMPRISPITGLPIP
ncbi:MAG: hypothetical protein R3C18_20640 [Planctomycetaceae bacterium]